MLFALRTSIDLSEYNGLQNSDAAKLFQKPKRHTPHNASLS